MTLELAQSMRPSIAIINYTNKLTAYSCEDVVTMLRTRWTSR